MLLIRHHHGKPDLDLFAVGVRKAGGDQADLACIGQRRSPTTIGVDAGRVRIQVDGLLSGILVVLAAVEVDDLTRVGEGTGEVGANSRENGVVAVVNRLDNSFKSGLRCQLLQLGVPLGRGGIDELEFFSKFLSKSSIAFAMLLWEAELPVPQPVSRASAITPARAKARIFFIAFIVVPPCVRAGC